MLSIPIYRNLLIADIEWRILPAIALGQCRLLRQKDMPVAFVTWAKLSEEVEARIKKYNDLRLTYTDWRSGERNCVIDIIALPPAVEPVLAGLGKDIFGGQSYTIRGMSPDHLSKMRDIVLQATK